MYLCMCFGIPHARNTFLLTSRSVQTCVSLNTKVCAVSHFLFEEKSMCAVAQSLAATQSKLGFQHRFAKVKTALRTQANSANKMQVQAQAFASRLRGELSVSEQLNEIERLRKKTLARPKLATLPRFKAIEIPLFSTGSAIFVY